MAILDGQQELDPSVAAVARERGMFAKRMREMLLVWPNRADHPRWELEDAIEQYRKLHPVLSKAGWLVALTGSVVREGSGQDLDLILVPWRTGATKDEAILLIEATFNAACVSRDRSGILVEEVGFCTKQVGQLVDAVICSGRCGPRFLRDETTRQKG